MAQKRRKKRPAREVTEEEVVVDESSDDASDDDRLRAADRRAFVRARQWAIGSCLGLVAGVALTATAGEVLGPLHELGATLGPLVSVLAIAAGIAAAHSLGRCGPDPELLDDAHPDHR